MTAVPKKKSVYLFEANPDFQGVWINRIKERRNELGMTQADLARLIGTRQSVISEYERSDYSKFTLRTLVKLSVALECDLKIGFNLYEKKTTSKRQTES